MKPVVRILVIVLFFKQASLLAQDIHFSQFSGSLLNLSPGHTGFYDGDYRIGAIYRSQWQSVPVKYNTFSLQGEKVISPLALENDLIGVGIVFNSDRAGDARYGTTQILASGSYIYKSFQDTAWRLSGGISCGWSQVGFDYSKMNFDSQFDGEKYVSSLGSNEQFLAFQRNYFDLNIGFAAQKRLETKSSFAFSFGAFHLTRPNISFNGSNDSQLDMKYTAVGNYNWYVNSKFDLLSEAMVSYQGKYLEVVPHLSAKYFFNRTEVKSVSAGLCYRAKDAIIARMGYTNNLLQAGISYDINLSKFTAATNYRGGFELYLIQIINSQPAFTPKKRACPSYY